MDVYFDSQTFMRQISGGISRYFADLINDFDRDRSLGIEVQFDLRFTTNEHLKDLRFRSIRELPRFIPRKLPYALSWLKPPRIPKSSKIVHHTYFSARFLSKLPFDTRRVVTVYDMIPEIFSGSKFFTQTHLAKAAYARASDLVICISESTEKDLLRFYPDLYGKTQVIPLAVASHFHPYHEPLPGAPDEYLLYVGYRAGYKDFRILLDALGILNSQGLSIPLVIVGHALTKAEHELISIYNLSNRITRIRATDAELLKLYSNASAVVQTSRYEGFGLSALEGMASGVPVILCDSSSMPEVGGDVALYFEPGNSESLAFQIQEVLTNQSLRNSLAIRGVERAQNFSTKKMSLLTSDAYRSIS